MENKYKINKIKIKNTACGRGGWGGGDQGAAAVGGSPLCVCVREAVPGWEAPGERREVDMETWVSLEEALMLKSFTEAPFGNRSSLK